MKRPAYRLGLCLLAAILCLLRPATARAASYLPLSDAELAVRSRFVVRARVLDSTARIETVGGGTYPFTTVRLERLESLKGSMPASFRVRIPGGRVGDLAWALPGTPAFVASQDVILFLDAVAGRPGEYRLTEFGLSKFDLMEDASGNRFAVRPVFSAREDDELSRRSPILSTQSPGHAPPRRRAESFLAALRQPAGTAPWNVEYAEPAAASAGGKTPSWVNIGGAEGSGSLFRWFWDTGASPNAVVTTSGTQANLSDGSTGDVHAQNAVAQWHGVSGVDIRYSGLSATGNVVVNLGAVSSFDGGTTWNTPLPCGSGGIIGLGGPGSSNGPRTFKGESRYFAPTSGTVSMRQRSGSSGCYSAALFRSAVLHELGHTLGLGHSDQAASTHSPDGPGSAEAAVAVMHSVIPSSFPSSPQPDDVLAVQYYYGATAATPAPAADFAAPASGAIGQTLAFTDTSTGNPTSWSWTFGDGTGSTQRNPTHAYAAAGAYAVTLVAGNSGGSTQVSRTITIAAAPTPVSGSSSASLPVAGHVTGEGGTVFVTDVVIENPNPFAIAASLLFFPVGGGTAPALALSLGAFESRSMPDVVANGFGVTNSFGALRLESAVGSAQPLRMTSRTYDDAGDGSFGMAVSGIPSSAASAESRFVTGLQRTAAFRSSIGAVNSSETAVTFAVVLRSGGGTVLGTSAPVTLPAGGQWQMQLGDLFPAAAGAALTVEFASVGGSPVPFSYGTLVDNLSGDPTYFPSARSATKLTLPVISRVTGVGGTLFVSELALANPSNLPAAVTLTFRERGRDNSTGSPSVALGLQPRETRSFEDALLALFGRSETFGALEIVANGPIVAGERISSASPTTAGTVGQQVDPIASDAFYSRASMLGLRQDASFRSNVGIVNPNPFPVAVALALRRGDGGVLATTTVSVPTVSAVQSALPALFPGTAWPAGAMLTVALDSGGASVAAYAIVADNRSGDLTASPAIP